MIFKIKHQGFSCIILCLVYVSCRRLYSNKLTSASSSTLFGARKLRSASTSPAVSGLSYGKTRFSFKKIKKSFQNLTPTARRSQVTEQRERTGEEAEYSRKLKGARSLENYRDFSIGFARTYPTKYFVLTLG